MRTAVATISLGVLLLVSSPLPSGSRANAATGPSCVGKTTDTLSRDLEEASHGPMTRDTARAITILNCLVAMNPLDWGWYKRRGDEYLFQGNYPAAIRDYTSQIAIESKAERRTSRGYVNRGQAYLYDEQFDAAVRDYQTAIDIERALPNYVSGLMGMCAVRARAYPLEQAIAACTAAGDRLPQDYDLWVSLGIAYSRAGRFIEARRSFDQAIVLGSGITDSDEGDAAFSATALYGRGMAKLRLGDRDGGSADVRRALALDPSSLRLAQYGVVDLRPVAVATPPGPAQGPFEQCLFRDSACIKGAMAFSTASGGRFELMSYGNTAADEGYLHAANQCVDLIVRYGDALGLGTLALPDGKDVAREFQRASKGMFTWVDGRTGGVLPTYGAVVSIAAWPGDSAGHVGIVARLTADPDGSITVHLFDQNMRNEHLNGWKKVVFTNTGGVWRGRMINSGSTGPVTAIVAGWANPAGQGN